MNNVGSVATRIAGLCLPRRGWQRPALFLQQELAASQRSMFCRTSMRIGLTVNPSAGLRSKFAAPSRSFSRRAETCFRQTTIVQKLVAHAPDSKEEKGLAFQDGDLTQEELHDVFGAVVPPARLANHLLRVLNGRRYDGTLDLDLPESVQATLKRYPYAFDSALRWLRECYPMDEDAAIIARIEREEANEEFSPAAAQQRAQDLGLYGPQSGHYRARLAEDRDDVFGVSELEKMRTENIAKAEKEEEELQNQINQLQAEVQEKQTKALAERPDQGIEAAKEVRPPNEFEKWVLKARNRAQSKLTLDSPMVGQTSTVKRLLPSAIFAALVCAGSYLFAQYWVPPKRSDRLFSDISLSFATVGALVAANLVIFGAWGLPPMWRLLNQYFIATPAYPRALSMLGNIFSHQSTKHLLVNMVGLVVFGLSLHEDVGRGTFMAIYLASGVLGSFASLANFAIQGKLITSSLGASGSVWGIMAAYCWIHSHEKFSFVFIPAEFQDKVQFTGWWFLTILIISQIVGVFSPIKKIDYASHVAGIGVGLASAEWWKRNQEASGVKRQNKNARWYEIMLGTQRKGDK